MKKKELKKLAKGLQKEIQESCDDFEVLTQPNDDGVSWVFSFNDELIGGASIETNIDSGVATVSFSIFYGRAEELDRDMLLEIFKHNSTKCNPIFKLCSVEENWWLTIESIILAESFKPTDFIESIYFLLSAVETIVKKLMKIEYEMPVEGTVH